MNAEGEHRPRTLRLVVAYDGTAYCGWQTQPDAPTVQGILTRAARALDPNARLTGASRTDAGVHALRQVGSLAITTTVSATAVMRALNATIPPDIRVLGAAEARPGFDARREATGKRYAYLVDCQPVAHPLLMRYAWHVPHALDVGAMRQALASLRGRHDFSAFCAAPGRAALPTCTIRATHVVCRRRWLGLVISADRFLHHMVRNIVGSAVAVGRGLHEPAWPGAVLRGGDRRLAAPTAPAHGLTLVRVLYQR
ncbi:MAG: tRNA pseudouridine(38-40) synthase TruA [Candidatus Rokuibacteriota bacterium]